MSSVIVPGSTVRMHYALRLEDGTLVESSYGAEPIEFEMGDGTLISGLERALYGLTTGAQQSIRISPKEGYGERDADRIHSLPRAHFDAEMPVDSGTIISFEMPSGEEVPGMIVAADSEAVQVDFNHPLAGHEVIFEVVVLAVHTPVANDDES